MAEQEKVVNEGGQYATAPIKGHGQTRPAEVVALPASVNLSTEAGVLRHPPKRWLP